MNSNNFDTNIPVYDAIPDKWEDARQFLVEHLKKISNGINLRQVGYYLDTETPTGGNFIPTTYETSSNGSDTEQYRNILRKVIDCSPLVAGANIFAHGLTIDSNFSNIILYVSATDTAAKTGYTMVYPEVTYDQTNIIINSPAAFARAFAIFEYIQEV